MELFDLWLPILVSAVFVFIASRSLIKDDPPEEPREDPRLTQARERALAGEMPNEPREQTTPPTNETDPVEPPPAEPTEEPSTPVEEDPDEPPTTEEVAGEPEADR